MSPSELEHVIARIKTWCDQKYGRRAELARTLGVSRQLVSAWLAGRRELSLKEYLAIDKIISQKPKGQKPVRKKKV
jgi:DNA-binding transcriptional regulator YdaS (Cro superfamily)